MYGTHILPDGRIRLHSVSTLLFYNVEADSFSHFDDDCSAVACNAGVLLDGVFFFYRDEWGVCGYDIVNQ